MQFFKDIQKFVANKKVFCGIDVHIKHWSICFICDGEVVQTLKLQRPTGPALLLILKKYYQSARSIHCVYKAGFSGTWLCRLLLDAGYNCIITPPNLTPRSGTKVKTDKRDAQDLASYLSAGLLKSVYLLPKKVESDRRIIRRRGQLVKKVTRAKAELKAFLNLHGIKKPEEIKNSWTKMYMSWLKSIEFEFESDRFILKHLIDSYLRLRQELANVTKQLRQLSKSEAYNANYKIMTVLRGVGLITAMSFLLEIHDFERFQNEKQFSGYLGLTPSQHSSGEHVRFGHITRQGNAHLRRVLVESAWTVIRHCPHLREKYDRIRAKGTNGKKAIVAIARSLAVRLRRCLLNQENYVVGVC